MDESGSTMSPTMPSSARASSATSRSSSKEPEHAGVMAWQSYGRREEKQARTATQAAIQEKTRANRGDRMTAALAEARSVSH